LAYLLDSAIIFLNFQEAIKLLGLEDIKQPTANEKKLAKKLVAKDEELKKSEREKGGIEKDKVRQNFYLFRLTIKRKNLGG